MKATALSLILAGQLMIAGAGAAVCDKTYYMQGGTQVILAGPTPAAIAQTGKSDIGKTMAGVEVLHPETEYDVVTRFEGAGACSEWKKTEMDFARRKVGSNEFKAVTVDTNLVKLNSIPYPFATGIDFEYWFGFASKVTGNTATIFEAIGKLKSNIQPHVWYGTATMTRTIFEKGAGGTITQKGTRTHYYQSLASHPDSSALQDTLLSTWSGFTKNDTQDVAFKVQLIKVVYDSVPPPVGIRGSASRPKTGSFQASQSGKVVFIRPGDGKVAPSEALGLYNMMGHKIATLHPTGYLYQWNGRTAVGAEAPTGVYFVQSGSRILGKFFYSR